jgi:hypothetical protein
MHAVPHESLIAGFLFDTGLKGRLADQLCWICERKQLSEARYSTEGTLGWGTLYSADRLQLENTRNRRDMVASFAVLAFLKLREIILYTAEFKVLAER